MQLVVKEIQQLGLFSEAIAEALSANHFQNSRVDV